MADRCRMCRRTLHTDTTAGECYGDNSGEFDGECLQIAVAIRDAEVEQVKGAILRSGRDEKYAAVYAWLDDNRDEVIKTLSDETGRLESELIDARSKHTAAVERHNVAYDNLRRQHEGVEEHLRHVKAERDAAFASGVTHAACLVNQFLDADDSAIAAMLRVDARRLRDAAAEPTPATTDFARVRAEKRDRGVCIDPGCDDRALRSYGDPDYCVRHNGGIGGGEPVATSEVKYIVRPAIKGSE